MVASARVHSDSSYRLTTWGNLGQVAYLSEPWPLILNVTEFEWQ